MLNVIVQHVRTTYVHGNNTRSMYSLQFRSRNVFGPKFTDLAVELDNRCKLQEVFRNNITLPVYDSSTVKQ